MIDLRADTVTRPSEQMRAAMAKAEVGDDVYGEDPTARQLEERVAELLGKQAALFTPSGSMANILAVASLVGHGQEVLCEATSHIARSELGAHGAVIGVTMRTWVGGALDLEMIEQLFAPEMSPFLVATKAISVENTHNFSGGTVIDHADLMTLRSFADRNQVAVHLDGARLWNAHVATGIPLADYGDIADVITVCLSKGLGAPIGSLVVGSKATIEEARIRRKRFGGGMRQIGMLAAAGLYALDHNLERLAEDHANAAVIAEAIGAPKPDTNIVVMDVPDAAAAVAKAAEFGVALVALGPRTLRAVTHLDVSTADARTAAGVLARVCG